MNQPEFNRRSHAWPRASLSEATLTERGFTAGGSGTVSTEAIASNRPRTQMMHDLDFIPARTRVSMITDFQCRNSARWQETSFPSKAAGEWANRSFGSPAFRRSLCRAEFAIPIKPSDHPPGKCRITGAFIPAKPIEDSPNPALQLRFAKNSLTTA